MVFEVLFILPLIILLASSTLSLRLIVHKGLTYTPCFSLFIFCIVISSLCFLLKAWSIVTILRYVISILLVCTSIESIYTSTIFAADEPRYWHFLFCISTGMTLGSISYLAGGAADLFRTALQVCSGGILFTAILTRRTIWRRQKLTSDVVLTKQSLLFIYILGTLISSKLPTNISINKWWIATIVTECIQLIVLVILNEVIIY